jgi:hypothetical protein
MQCRQCGTEIADKAIVCFRCGVPTTDPVRRAVPVRRKGSPLLALVAMAALLLIALYQGYAYKTAANPEPLQMYVGILAAVVLLILLVRVVLRRR